MPKDAAVCALYRPENPPLNISFMKDQTESFLENDESEFQGH